MDEGFLAEFEDAERLVDALGRLKESGHKELDAYTPFPVEGIARVLALPRSNVSRFTFLGAIAGCATGFFGQWWISAVDYPINAGGRPLASFPAFVPVTFELTILFGALATVLGLFLRARLGALWSRVDEPGMLEGASIDRYVLAVGGRGAGEGMLERRLRELGATRVVPFGGEG
jgi:hypothetical protein